MLVRLMCGCVRNNLMNFVLRLVRQFLYGKIEENNKDLNICRAIPSNIHVYGNKERLCNKSDLRA